MSKVNSNREACGSSAHRHLLATEDPRDLFVWVPVDIATGDVDITNLKHHRDEVRADSLLPGWVWRRFRLIETTDTVGLEFQREFLSEPQGEREAALMALADEYHRKCESYDHQHVCTGPIVNGVRQPATETEKLHCTQYARSLKDSIGYRAMELGFTWGQWVLAIFTRRRRR